MTEPVSSPRPVSLPGTHRSPIRKFFVRGAILLLPTLVTLWILLQALGFLQQNMIRYVTRLIAWSFTRIGLFPPDAYRVVGDRVVIARGLWFPSEMLSWILCLGLVVLAGVLVGSLVGRRLWTETEKALMRLPPMRFVYPFVKQMTDFLFTDRPVGYGQVVAVEYPRKGMCSLGFVTGKALPEIEKTLKAECLSVFVPSSPTPMTGYIVFVPEDEVVYLSITIEEAMKMIVSGGVIKPDSLVKDDLKPLQPSPDAPTVP